MDTESAQIIGLQAITYIMANEDLLSRFIALSGSSQEEFREKIRDPIFLTACLEFLLANEVDLLSFCTDSDIDPSSPMQAFESLGGNNSWDSI